MKTTQILIVEDEEIISLELTMRLERMGYFICTHATNYREALDQVFECSPDIILMDIRIEGEFDGIETAKLIMAKKKIPIIYLTAYADEETIDRAKETIPYGYLVKPVQERDLRIAIEMALHKVQIENELEKAREELIKERDLFSKGPVILTIWSPERGWPVLFVSENVKPILGYAQHEWYSSEFRFAQLIHVEDYERVDKTINDYVLNGIDSYELSYRIRKRDGNYLWFYDFGRIERDNKGEVVELKGYMFDQTQLKNAYRELELRKLRYKTVANYTYNWEYWKDVNNQFVYISPSVYRITGYTPQEFIDNPGLMDDIVYFEDRFIWTQHAHEVAESCSNEYVSSIEFRIVNKCNDIRWIHHTCRHINENDKYLGVRASNSDITKQFEAERKLINNTIEVEEKERLRFSRELHDGLGPLLATVKLYFQCLSETTDKEKAKLLAEKGLTSIDKAIKTIKEISRNISPIHIENEGFTNSFASYVEELGRLTQTKIFFSTNITKRFSSNLEISLYRIGSELLNNAIKYANAKTVTITCNYIPQRNVIHFTLADNGKGFNVSEIEGNSQGIGLPNIKWRVKSLGGKFSIESTIGKGTDVSIELPFYH